MIDALEPNPAAAQAAALRARQALMSSRGLLMVIVGAMFLLWAGLSFLVEGPLLSFIQGCFLLGMGVFFLFGQRRFLSWVRSPVQALGRGEVYLQSGTSPRRGWFVAFLAGLVVAGAGLGVLAASSQGELVPAVDLFYGCLAGVFAVGAVAIGLHQRLWEVAATFAVFAVGTALVSIEGLSVVGLLALAGATSVGCGVSLHLRWRRWVEEQRASTEQAG